MCNMSDFTLGSHMNCRIQANKDTKNAQRTQTDIITGLGCDFLLHVHSSETYTFFLFFFLNGIKTMGGLAITFIFTARFLRQLSKTGRTCGGYCCAFQCQSFQKSNERKKKKLRKQKAKILWRKRPVPDSVVQHLHRAGGSAV